MKKLRIKLSGTISQEIVIPVVDRTVVDVTLEDETEKRTLVLDDKSLILTDSGSDRFIVI